MNSNHTLSHSLGNLVSLTTVSQPLLLGLHSTTRQSIPLPLRHPPPTRAAYEKKDGEQDLAAPACTCAGSLFSIGLPLYASGILLCAMLC